MEPNNERMDDIDTYVDLVSDWQDYNEEYGNIRMNGYDVPVKRFKNEDFQDKVEEDYRHALVLSTSKEIVPYVKKSKKPVNKLERAAKIALLVVALIGVGKVVQEVAIPSNEPSYMVKAEAREAVDERIKYYEEKMGVNGEFGYRIETAHDRDYTTGEAYVSYDTASMALANQLKEAVKQSESEARCVIIAAYNVINEPYREQVLGNAIKDLADDQELKDLIGDDMSYLVAGGAQGFLEGLGYENWDDYRMNERKNIKEIRAIEDAVNLGTGRS